MLHRRKGREPFSSHAKEQLATKKQKLFVSFFLWGSNQQPLEGNVSAAPLDTGFGGGRSPSHKGLKPPPQGFKEKNYHAIASHR